MTADQNEECLFQIAVIGAGQIGFRHLQSLCKIDKPVSLSVVDPDPVRLQKVKSLLEGPSQEVSGRLPVVYLSRISDLSPKLDVVVIATNSDIRASITRELLEEKEPGNIIFEKVAFQSVPEFEEICGIIEHRQIGAWVNCPRRMYPIYEEIRRIFTDETKITYTVHGGDWGLASNAIHFLDHLAFLNPSCGDAKLETYALDKTIYLSKRKGFIELAGSLFGSYPQGSTFILQARKEVLAPHIITILGSETHIEIDEIRGMYRVARKENQWRWQDIPFVRPLQSELTHLAVKGILEDGGCGLTDLRESFRYHRSLLDAVARHLRAITGREPERCPIT